MQPATVGPILIWVFRARCHFRAHAVDTTYILVPACTAAQGSDTTLLIAALRPALKKHHHLYCPGIQSFNPQLTIVSLYEKFSLTSYNFRGTKK